MADPSKPSRSESRPAKGRGKPTLRTIADITGLAVTTVSRALANAPQISIETRKRVRQVAIDIGYSPDRAAQRLKTGRTNVIAVLLEPHEEILGYGTSVMAGVAKALQGTSYHLIVMPNFLNGANLDAVNYIIRNGMADGLIFSRTEPLDPRVMLLSETGFPFVTHGRTELATAHPFVDHDNFTFAYEATRRLIAKGRHKPALISGPAGFTFSGHILHGFMTAVREAGCAYEILSDIDLDSPAGAIRDRIRRRNTEKDPPDGFACGGEVCALATITGMSDYGLTLGVEYDIVAKQTSHLLSAIQPRVDTIYEDLTATGEHMGHILLRRIGGSLSMRELQLLLSPELPFETRPPEIAVRDEAS
ncbi:LacI family transcriptional regulator [Sinorhizobium numidicum]|uniref:LacI family transcriptional regulator n=1 Tax=Sinorhizobium numidicum TaxID=680248 RepID=A0ABY8CZG1_9HYPH|nr:LacI family transcriptional regulator [Sinorhizobium numidicum]WEX77370.1 LacI family transcriptional regulator [Sinorhizobium numidicum]WEX84029.1 LacI family transcriptional regulator [Sinorhizobium numidicum]